MNIRQLNPWLLGVFESFKPLGHGGSLTRMGNSVRSIRDELGECQLAAPTSAQTKGSVKINVLFLPVEEEDPIIERERRDNALNVD